MTTTIDRAGRVVVPKQLRDRFNLAPGTELEVAATSDGVLLRKVGTAPALIRKQGILIHHGSARVTLDIVEFMRAERAARSQRLAGDDV